MIHIHFGTDWYGAVKRVDAFQVVTEFFHIYNFPLYPRYSAILGRSAAPGGEWQILPLARIDWQSVTIAYIRGVAGGLVVVGSIPLLFGFIFWLLNDNQTDIPPELIMSVGGVGVAIGAVLGGASYLLWQRPNARECLIRHVAASQLFPAADPAQINRSLATDWADELDAMLLDNGITDYRDASRRPHEFSLITRQLLLLRLRCHVALAEPDPIIDGQIEALLRDLATQKH